MCKKLDYLNDYYIEIYDEQDNYIGFLENIENACKLFNKELKEVLRKLRNNEMFVKNGKKYKLFLNKKELSYKEIRCSKRWKNIKAIYSEIGNILNKSI